MKIRVRTLAILALVFVAFVVIVQNTEIVSVRILFWDLVMSRIVLLALSVAVGAIIGLLLGRPWRKREEYARPRSVDSKAGDSSAKR